MCILRDQWSDISMFKSWWIQIITGDSPVIPRHPCLQHSAALQGTVLLRPIRKRKRLLGVVCCFFGWNVDQKTPVDQWCNQKNPWNHSKKREKNNNCQPQLDVNGCQMSSAYHCKSNVGSRMVAPLQHNWVGNLVLDLFCRLSSEAVQVFMVFNGVSGMVLFPSLSGVFQDSNRFLGGVLGSSPWFETDT